jgi:probable blue pigment (indigoidine) exporter
MSSIYLDFKTKGIYLDVKIVTASMNSSRILATTAIAPLIWGTSYIVTSEFLPPDRPLLAATLRALPAGLALLAFTRVLPRGDWWWKASVLGILNIGAFFAFLFISAYRLPGGVSATLGAVHPLLVALLTVVVLHQAIARRTVLTAVLGLVGVAMLVMTPDAALDGVGVVAGLAGGLATAFGVILTKRWGRPVSLIAFTAWQLVAGGLALLVPAVILEGLPPVLTLANVAGYAWLAVPGTLIAYLFWFRGILALPAAKVTLLGFLAPLGATLIGWIALDQSLSPLQWLGAVVIVSSVAIGAPTSRNAQITVPESPASLTTDSLVTQRA